MFDDIIVVYKFYGDLMFFVTGSQSENELILYAVLQAFYESISLLLRCRARSQHPPQPERPRRCHAPDGPTLLTGAEFEGERIHLGT